jgi:protein-tyrosine phosphatase
MAERGHAVQVRSVGIAASAGAPASNHAIFVAEEWGTSLREHRSRPVDDKILSTTHLLLGMTRSHCSALRGLIGSDGPELMTLAELAGVDEEVRDPFGGSLDDYQATFEQLTRLIQAALPALEDRIRASEG